LACGVSSPTRPAGGWRAAPGGPPPLDAPATPEAILRAADAMREIGGT
jgi:xanthine dehydrogenase large subunit